MRTRTFITVTDVRRDTARIMAQVRTSAAPLFVTQYGYIAAVLMSPSDYEVLCAAEQRLLERRRQLIRALLDGPGPGDREAPRHGDRDDGE